MLLLVRSNLFRNYEMKPAPMNCPRCCFFIGGVGNLAFAKTNIARLVVVNSLLHRVARAIDIRLSYEYILISKCEALNMKNKEIGERKRYLLPFLLFIILSRLVPSNFFESLSENRR